MIRGVRENWSTTMLPHPTTSSFSSAIASRRFSFRGRPVAGARIVFADPSAFNHLGIAFAQCAESCGEFPPFVIAERRCARADSVTIDHAEFLERRLECRDGRTIGLCAAFESARDAKFLDRVGIQ